VLSFLLLVLKVQSNCSKKKKSVYFSSIGTEGPIKLFEEEEEECLFFNRPFAVNKVTLY